jgi:large subunit ribosomal protein L10
MPTKKKVKIIESRQEVFTESNNIILTDYRGLTTAELTALRRKVEEVGARYRVVKNSLARLAAEKTGKTNLDTLFKGPTAVAFCYGDITNLAKTFMEYVRTTKLEVTIKGGFLGDRPLSSEEVKTLSTLPSREILLARVLGGLQSPIATFITCSALPLRGLLGILQARIKQLEEV